MSGEAGKYAAGRKASDDEKREDRQAKSRSRGRTVRKKTRDVRTVGD